MLMQLLGNAEERSVWSVCPNTHCCPRLPLHAAITTLYPSVERQFPDPPTTSEHPEPVAEGRGMIFLK